MERRRKPHLTLRECEASATLKHTYLGFFLPDPEDVISLSLGAICNFIDGAGSSDLGISRRGTKDMSKRPTCTGTGRARTRLQFNSILFYSVLFCSVLFYSIPSHVCRVFTIIYPKQTVSFGHIALQLSCSSNLCYMQCYFACKKCFVLLLLLLLLLLLVVVVVVVVVVIVVVVVVFPTGSVSPQVLSPPLPAETFTRSPQLLHTISSSSVSS